MLKVDYNLVRHPKIIAAGRKIGGRDGVAVALAVYLDCLSYSDSLATDGYIPDDIIAHSPATSRATDVAKVLATSAIRLLHRVRGGYVIHDFHDFNATAEQVNELRAKKREQKRKERAREKTDPVATVNDLSPRDKTATRARARSYPLSRSLLSTKRTTRGRAREPGEEPNGTVPEQSKSD